MRAYLAGVEHATLVDLADSDPVYRTTDGSAPSTAPEQVDWVAQSSGSGRQQITWPVENGDWTVVVMNADASPDVAVEAAAGAEVPAMRWLIGILLTVAAITLVLSIVLIAVPVQRRGTGRCLRMITTLVVAFLVAHGLVHFAVWLPHPEPDPDKPAPFAPDHSAVLTKAAVPQTTARTLSTVLAVAAGVGFLLTGLAVAIDADWAVPMAVVRKPARPVAQGPVLQPVAAPGRSHRRRRAARCCLLALALTPDESGTKSCSPGECSPGLCPERSLGTRQPGVPSWRAPSTRWPDV